jgi:hypothetical protein
MHANMLICAVIGSLSPISLSCTHKGQTQKGLLPVGVGGPGDLATPSWFGRNLCCFSWRCLFVPCSTRMLEWSSWKHVSRLCVSWQFRSAAWRLQSFCRMQCTSIFGRWVCVCLCGGGDTVLGGIYHFSSSRFCYARLLQSGMVKIREL